MCATGYSGIRVISIYRRWQLTLLLFIAVLPSPAYSYDACDNELEAGEPAGGPFMDLPYRMVEHWLAQKVCGAPPVPMAPRFLGYIERRGCGPSTAIYLQVKKSAEWMEGADLAAWAAENSPQTRVSADQARKAARAMVEELGGCGRLRQSQAAELP